MPGFRTFDTPLIANQTQHAIGVSRRDALCPPCAPDGGYSDAAPNVRHCSPCCLEHWYYTGVDLFPEMDGPPANTMSGRINDLLTRLTLKLRTHHSDQACPTGHWRIRRAR